MIKKYILKNSPDENGWIVLSALFLCLLKLLWVASFAKLLAAAGVGGGDELPCSFSHSIVTLRTVFLIILLNQLIIINYSG
jgi:hypothetical protein